MSRKNPDPAGKVEKDEAEGSRCSRSRVPARSLCLNIPLSGTKSSWGCKRKKTGKKNPSQRLFHGKMRVWKLLYCFGEGILCYKMGTFPFTQIIIGGGLLWDFFLSPEFLSVKSQGCTSHFYPLQGSPHSLIWSLWHKALCHKIQNNPGRRGLTGKDRFDFPMEPFPLLFCSAGYGGDATPFPLLVKQLKQQLINQLINCG